MSKKNTISFDLLRYDILCDAIWIVKKVKFKSQILALLYYVTHKPFYDGIKVKYEHDENKRNEV